MTFIIFVHRLHKFRKTDQFCDRYQILNHVQLSFAEFADDSIDSCQSGLNAGNLEEFYPLNVPRESYRIPSNEMKKFILITKTIKEVVISGILTDCFNYCLVYNLVLHCWNIMKSGLRHLIDFRSLTDLYFRSVLNLVACSFFIYNLLSSQLVRHHFKAYSYILYVRLALVHYRRKDAEYLNVCTGTGQQE